LFDDGLPSTDLAAWLGSEKNGNFGFRGPQSLYLLGIARVTLSAEENTKTTLKRRIICFFIFFSR
jgi:hypothetical protein